MNSRVNKILIGLLSLIVLLIFLLPFCWVFFVGDGDDQGHWKKSYLIEDWISLMFYLPFVILWAIYLMRTKAMDFWIFKILLVGTAFLIFAIAFYQLQCQVKIMNQVGGSFYLYLYFRCSLLS